MKAPTVRLYIRITLANGRQAYAKPVWNRNRSLREGFALVGDREERHTEGIYYLRYAPPGEKRRWHSVGPSADVAITSLRRKEHDLQGGLLDRKPASHAEHFIKSPTPDRQFLSAAKDRYLKNLQSLKRAPKTLSAYRNALSRFCATVGDKRLSDLTRDDLLCHMDSLRSEGLSERSIYNHIEALNFFLRDAGITGLLKKNDKPRFEQKLVTTYGEDEIRRLLSSCDSEHRLLWEFFLFSGFRDQEVTFSTWANLDLEKKIIYTRSLPDYGFELKDHEQRAVPLPDVLLFKLAKRKKVSTSRFIFPTRNGKPDTKLLQKLKTDARRAGLNCGHCLSRNGHKCSSAAECANWTLHKFRKTFATMHCEAQVSVKTIQAWLGHADLETTQTYLAAADMRSSRTREQVNSSFKSVTEGTTSTAA